MSTMAATHRYKLGLLITFVILWFAMFAFSIDTLDWFIENILVFIALPVLLLTHKKFQFSNLGYTCIFLFLVLHIWGAQYAYTKHPVGAWFKEQYHLWRNPYDRVVHFRFGFLLVTPLYELLTKKLKVKGRWQYILPCEIILSFACIFELIEWTVAALTTKETGETYVATQGDVWDAHKDIVLALLGAAIIMFLTYLQHKKSLTTRQ
jgi:putative membrane protein